MLFSCSPVHPTWLAMQLQWPTQTSVHFCPFAYLQWLCTSLNQITNSSLHLQVACPPTWMVAGFAGQVNAGRHGGYMGSWDTSKTPPLAHFVGAPDKAQNMKYGGFWNYDSDVLAAWTSAAHSTLQAQWKGSEGGEDGEAAHDPFAPEVATRLQQEGEKLRTQLGSLEQFRSQCASIALACHVRARVSSEFKNLTLLFQKCSCKHPIALASNVPCEKQVTSLAG